MDDEKDKPPNPNPVTEANFMNKIFFWWLNPLFSKGHKRRLEQADLYDILRDDSSEHLCQCLEKHWCRELEKKKQGGTPSLRAAMVNTFGRLYMSLGMILFLEEGVKVLQPLLMGGLIRYFSPDSTTTLTEAYLYAMGVGLCAMVIAVAHHPYFFMTQRVGMWLRVACCSMLYKKSLRLSNKALGQTTTGQIVNLMSNDVVRFDQSVIFLHFLWIGPLQGIAVLAILWYELGPASLSGFALLVLLIPVQGFMGKLFASLRQKTAQHTDKRVRTMNEILQGMRVLKMYCWENMFADLINKIRSLEISRILACGYARAATIGPFFASAKLIFYLTFLTYIIQGSPMRAEQVFVALALFNPIRLSLTLFVSFAIQMLSETKITIDRVQNFLMLEELAETSSIVRPPEPPKPSECKVTAMNITAIWDEALPSNTLDDLSFEARAGELMAVIGPVGAGKSSLLMSLLGELPLSRGSVKLGGRIAYVSQQPWVYSASVRQNVLFGKPYDKALYNRTVYAAALTKDLEMMPAGDLTLVGERGVSLSGGQKARISLARALYHQADIYLLDDPLSAVDAAVGRHIYDKCIKGFLKDKVVILVTHQLQYLQTANQILILKEGQAMALGTYSELATGGVDFAALLKRDDEDEDDEDVPASPPPYEDTMTNHHAALQQSQSDPDAYLSKSVEYLTQVSLIQDEAQTSLLSRSVDPASSYLDAGRSAKSPRQSRSQHRALSPGLRSRHPKPVLSPLAGVKSAESIVMGSVMSLESVASDIQGDYIAPQQEEETREAGTVGSSVYLQYYYRGAGALGLVVFVILNLVAQGAYIASDWWLSHWSNLEESRARALHAHESLLEAGHNITNITIPDVPTNKYLYIYSGVTAAVFIFGMLRALHVFHILVTAAKYLHNAMFGSIIRTPVLFFDTNPVGRILNRFSKDMGAVDELLPLTMYDFIHCGLMILGIVLVAGIVNPWVFIPTVPLGVVFVFIRRYYLSTSRDIKRLEATTRSPVFSLVSASLLGLQTLRAYGVQQDFSRRFDGHQDRHSEAWYMFLSTSRWLAVRLDWLCAIFISVVALCSVLAAGSMNGGLVGLSLTYAIGLMGLFQWGVRQSAEVENQMTSVERIMEYISLTPEAPLTAPQDRAPPPGWPHAGAVSVKDASFRYTDDGQDVLKAVCFNVRPREKVGIVGRTGAGKSSLIAMLFRLAEPRGHVTIDDVDITALGLHDLRSKISIIPQDPVLFTGSIRENLDPFQQHEDSSLWNALEEVDDLDVETNTVTVQLKPTVQDLPGRLEFAISEGGINFSVGQRQLVCLARAVLKRNRVLIIDEATANVDPRTDALIQETIREKFRECTVLTIAHRLNTIMDSDRVMVLKEGELREFEEPYSLLQRPESLFYEMVAQGGPSELEHLTDIARETFYAAEKHAKTNGDAHVLPSHGEDNGDAHVLPSHGADNSSKDDDPLEASQESVRKSLCGDDDSSDKADQSQVEVPLLRSSSNPKV